MYAGVLSLCILGSLLNRLFLFVGDALMSWYKGVTETRR